MDNKLRNFIATPVKDGQRIMRVITTDGEYYDVIITGGTNISQQWAIAKQAHVLSGRYYEMDRLQELDVERIVLCRFKDGVIKEYNGEPPIGHSGFLDDEETVFMKQQIDSETFDVVSEERIDIKILYPENYVKNEEV